MEKKRWRLLRHQSWVQVQGLENAIAMKKSTKIGLQTEEENVGIWHPTEAKDIYAFSHLKEANYKAVPALQY